MLRHDEIGHEELRTLIEQGEVTFAGHAGLEIYGRLDCRVGRRYMARRSRVFFASEEEAVEAGYRPCMTCMRSAYRAWKAEREAAAAAAAWPFPALAPLTPFPALAPLAPLAPVAPLAPAAPLASPFAALAPAPVAPLGLAPLAPAPAPSPLLAPAANRLAA